MNEEPSNTAGGPQEPVREPDVPDTPNPATPYPVEDPPRPYPVEDPMPGSDPGVEPNITPEDEPRAPEPVVDPLPESRL
jgi:hypothetical protein